MPLAQLARPEEIERNFWRIEAIPPFVEYPEKTDRLVQRQRRGNPGRPFCFWGWVHGLPARSRPLIDPSSIFSLSSPRASRLYLGANARD
jgi:hypothetical protein